jgi:hypothetical protein
MSNNSAYPQLSNLQSVALLNLAMATHAIADENQYAKNNVIRLEPIKLDSSFWNKYDVKRKKAERPSEEDLKTSWEHEIAMLESFGIISDVRIKFKSDGNISYYELSVNNTALQQFYVTIIDKILPYVYTYLRQNESQVLPLKDNEYKCSWNLNAMGNPEVIIGSNKYKMPEMREGRAYNLISYCFEHYPNKPVLRPKLLNEMKSNGIGVEGITSLKEAVRKSIFGEEGVLGFFVSISPKSIMVQTETVINDKQLQLIIDTAKS